MKNYELLLIMEAYTRQCINGLLIIVLVGDIPLHGKYMASIWGRGAEKRLAYILRADYKITLYIRNLHPTYKLHLFTPYIGYEMELE